MRVSEESEGSEGFWIVISPIYLCMVPFAYLLFYSQKGRGYFTKKHIDCQVSQSFTNFTNCQTNYDEWRHNTKLHFDI